MTKVHNNILENNQVLAKTENLQMSDELASAKNGDNPVHFDVSTGLKRVLGSDLIIDDEVAIFELVKNSFDAGADTASSSGGLLCEIFPKSEHIPYY